MSGQKYDRTNRKGEEMNMRNKKAFTIIELLVVVAIIAILAAMLLPSLNQAREYAKKVNCLNNMKQCGMFIQSYAMENKDLFLTYFRPVTGTEYVWADFAANRDTTLMNQMRKILRCTSMAPLEQWTESWAAGKYNTYGIWNMNYFTPTYYQSLLSGALQYYTLGKVKSPSRLPMLADSLNTAGEKQSYTFYPAYPSPSGPMVHFRHNNTANFWFSDGHGEAKRPSDYYSDVMTSCNQGRPTNVYYYSQNRAKLSL